MMFWNLIDQVRFTNTAGSAVTFNASLEFPPAAMITSSTTFTASNAQYGFGTYIATASTFAASNAKPQHAFDFNKISFWHSYDVYNSQSGWYQGSANTTNSNGTVHVGEWIQIQLPIAISLDSFAIYPRLDGNLYNRRSPRNFILFGSNQGLTWDTLHSSNNTFFLTGDPKRFTSIWNRTPFSYFRLSIQRTGTVDYSANGYQESVQLSMDLYGTSTGSDSSAFLTSSVEYPGAVRIESFKYPGYILQSLNNTVQFRKDLANDGAFKNESAFYPTEGLGGRLVPIT